MNAASGGVARLRGFEPLTHGSGGRCSVRAELQAQEIPPDTSRGRDDRATSSQRLVGAIPQHHNSYSWSGLEDLNLRPPAPKAGALPGCATPRSSACPHPDQKSSCGCCGTILPHQCGMRTQAAPSPETTPPSRSPPVPEPHQDLPTRLQGFGAMTDSVFQCRPDLGQRLTIFGDVKNGVVTEPGRPPRLPRDIPFTDPFGKLGRSPRLGHGDHTTKTGGPSVPGVGPKLLEDPLDPIVVGRPLPYETRTINTPGPPQ